MEIIRNVDTNYSNKMLDHLKNIKLSAFEVNKFH
jgi:hypothetical protein